MVREGGGLPGGCEKFAVGCRCTCGEKRGVPVRYSSVRVCVIRCEQGDRLLMWLCCRSPPYVKGAGQSQHATIPSLIVVVVTCKIC